MRGAGGEGYVAEGVAVSAGKREDGLLSVYGSRFLQIHCLDRSQSGKQGGGPSPASLENGRNERNAWTVPKSSKSSEPVTKSSRPRADQFCAYNIGGEGETKHRVAALTIEYKAPHKLTLGHIYGGLVEMNLDELRFPPSHWLIIVGECSRHPPLL